ncbi:MAG: hypothetical protein HOB73_05915 [Planctomycetaceae bacterium]|nr:hypothetical protein [Planctomycetaceae bacterium]
MTEQFDPYRKWLGIPDQTQHPHHYQLLGLALFEDDPDVIENAANRQMTHIRSFQTGQYASYSQDLLNEISRAKICLLRPDSKANYDLQLQTKLKATTSHPRMDPMIPVATTAIPVATAANTEVATPVRAAASTEQATPVRPDNPLNELSSQVTIGSSAVSHRARTRKSNAGLPWLMALGALVGVGLLVVVLMFLLNNPNGAFPWGNGAFPWRNEVIPNPNEAIPNPNEAIPNPNEAIPKPNEAIPE